ncbi:hypothetical protein GF1_08210 [Desulfolithobacter dissulfuricans]|uniref:DUF3800 domain-containing protein n=1 Tax=Desulfolithobacter dissulfuricans TaxID=2795293 RepID=A0A915U0C7_9BACT|nr:DUF3800 domain-containing protein [Desulfolithobacter dissulfuricans]BCO08445.1 hypothetical protein GF1_08210 [Desulfolithobacter dissulfuricans]
MKVCYCDESGTGDEPIAVLVGVVVDSQRMHVTKEHWGSLLESLSTAIDRELSEIHTRNFYAGSGIWHGMDGNKRSEVISLIFNWIKERKHHFVYSSVIKEKYYANLEAGNIPIELNTLWRFLGFHLVLSMQKKFQTENKNKGNTIFVFDNEEREQMRFTDLINNPPAWSESYYRKEKKKPPLNQIVDVPYFGDSKQVPLIQVADVMAFFLSKRKKNRIFNNTVSSAILSSNHDT